MSGEHVVYGFLQPLIANFDEESNAIILHYKSQEPPSNTLAQKVTTIVVSDKWRHWALRAAWEMLRLPGLTKSRSVDLVFNVSGAITPFCPVPQISLAMNPWCYIKAARSGWIQEVKAFMQRRAYRKAYRDASRMIYISRHLRSLYRQAYRDCIDKEAASTIAYVGLNDELFESAQQMSDLPRKPCSILSVSAFAPWKGVETLVEAVGLLRERNIPATLSLVGPWPDAAYETQIRDLLLKSGLDDAVTIHGKVEVEELYLQFASHQVYCLMSSCESFGIPAAEAMAFGTPVVSTQCCAIAEVCDHAGLFGPVNDPNWTANALASLLTDQAVWTELSENARHKAANLSWAQCVQPLLEIPELFPAQTAEVMQTEPT